jgi:SET domain
MDERQLINLIELFCSTLRACNVPEKEIPMDLSERFQEFGFPSLNCVEVKPSPIHGNGIFAKRDIEAGKVVTLYPCHGIIIGNIAGCQKKHEKYMSHFKPSDYKVILGREDNAFAFGIPEIYSECLSGHLINDSFADVNCFDSTSNENDFGKNAVAYMLQSIKNDNCSLISAKNCVYVKATKNILAGEELFCSYGFGYWCNNKTIKQIAQMFSSYISKLPIKQKEYVKKLTREFREKTKPITLSEEDKNMLNYTTNMLKDPAILTSLIASRSN